MAKASSAATKDAKAPTTVLGESEIVRLELSDASSHKFWQISVAGLRTTVSYGKIGSNGISQLMDHTDEQAAATFVIKQLTAKQKKGYLKVSDCDKEDDDNDDEETEDAHDTSDSLTRLELAEGSSDKFWQISVDGPRCGKIGSRTGVTQVKDHTDKESAATIVSKALVTESKKGYSDIIAASKKLKFAQGDRSTMCKRARFAVPSKPGPISSLPEEILAAVVDFVAINELRAVATTSKIMLTAVQHSLKDQPSPVSYSREELTKFFAEKDKFVGTRETIAADDLPPFYTYPHIWQHVATYAMDVSTSTDDAGGFFVTINGMALILLSGDTEFKSCTELTCWHNTQTRIVFLVVTLDLTEPIARIMMSVYDLPDETDLQTTKIAPRQNICLKKASEIENNSNSNKGLSFDYRHHVGRGSISGDGSVLAVFQHVQCKYEKSDGFFIAVFDIIQETSIGADVGLFKKNVIELSYFDDVDGMVCEDSWLHIGLSAHGNMLLASWAMGQCGDTIGVWDTRGPTPTALGECTLHECGYTIDFDDFRCNNRVTVLQEFSELHDNEKNMSISEVIRSRIEKDEFYDAGLELPAFLKPRRCVVFRMNE